LLLVWLASGGALKACASAQKVSCLLIDRTDRRDKSLFRLGLDWLKYALKDSIDFQPEFHFLALEALIHVR
jgi:hypothetical protein